MAVGRTNRVSHFCPNRKFPECLTKRPGAVSRRSWISDPESHSKISNLMIIELFVHVFLISTEVLFIQDV